MQNGQQVSSRCAYDTVPSFLVYMHLTMHLLQEMGNGKLMTCPHAAIRFVTYA